MHPTEICCRRSFVAGEGQVTCMHHCYSGAQSNAKRYKSNEFSAQVLGDEALQGCEHSRKKIWPIEGHQQCTAHRQACFFIILRKEVIDLHTKKIPEAGNSGNKDDCTRVCTIQCIQHLMYKIIQHSRHSSSFHTTRLHHNDTSTCRMQKPVTLVRQKGHAIGIGLAPQLPCTCFTSCSAHASHTLCWQLLRPSLPLASSKHTPHTRSSSSCSSRKRC